jgi:putative CocE/NonD family hydrolase
MQYVMLLLALLVLLVAAVFYFRRALLARLLELPPPLYSVAVERAIPLTMADGVTLLTDHYWPKDDGNYPTILIRTPYGRGREVFLFGGYPLGELPAQRFAERGYHVIVQGARGCFDSEGDFAPHINEAADGKATADWIERQPWFDGRLAAWGPSYLGYSLWATAVAKATTTPSSQLAAIVPIITSAENFSVTHPEGAFGLETRLRWSQGQVRAKLMHERSFVRKVRHRLFGKDEEALQAAYMHLPVRDADEAATGQPAPFYREMLANSDQRDPYWMARDFSQAVGQVEAPAHLIGGWYDYYLPALLRDYAALKSAGHQPYLTIGPWYHASADGLLTGLREGLNWFDAKLKGMNDNIRHKPVRVYLLGAGEWREMTEFPPQSQSFRYYLQDDGVLGADLPERNSTPDSFVYDPADPTPALGGALLAFKGAGPQDNRPLEARSDVLYYTSPTLEESLEIAGPVSVTLFVRSSRQFTDFFGRLCDVYPDGRSVNICDGLVRIRPGDGQVQPDGILELKLDLSVTACRFLSGHRLRLLISSGAHPRWNRNLGLGEVESTAVEMVAAEQTIFHDPDHPSFLSLPLVENEAS